MRQLAPAYIIQRHTDRLIWQAELTQGHAIIIFLQAGEGSLICCLQLHTEHSCPTTSDHYYGWGQLKENVIFWEIGNAVV